MSVLLYSAVGAGKTYTSVIGKEKTAYLNLNGENGLRGIDIAANNIRDIKISSPQQLLKLVETDIKKLDKFDVIVLDNITQLNKLYETSLTRKKGVLRPNKMSFDDWAGLNDFMYNIISDLEKYCHENDKELIVLAHEQAGTAIAFDEDNEMVELAMMEPKIRKQVAADITGIFDFVMYLISECDDEDHTSHTLLMGKTPTHVTKVRTAKKVPRYVNVTDKSLMQILKKF